MGQQILKATGVRGEITPLAHARQDIETYQQSFASILNWFVLREGGVRRRSGTRHRGLREASTHVRLVPFRFATDQSFVLEFLPGKIRFWKDRELVLDSGLPYELPTTYTQTDIPNLQYEQIDDIIFFACDGHKPRELRRVTNTNWQLVDYVPIDGPYLQINDANNILKTDVALTTGALVRFSWTNTLGINGDAGLVATDVGRMVRAQFKGNWSYGVIEAVIDDKTADVRVQLGRGGGGVGTSTDPVGGGAGYGGGDITEGGIP